MDFALLPPEINSARMYAGPGAGPLLAAAAAWDGLAAQLGSAAASYQSVVSGLTGQWLGPSSMAMSTAAVSYVAWMNTTAAQAEQAASQAKAAAAAYETAFAMTMPPPVIAANRAQLAALVATNFLGQNTPAIAATEAHYGEMWAQDAAAMYGYAGGAAAATRLTPFTAPKQTTNPSGLGGQSVAVAHAASTSAGTQAQNAMSSINGVSQALGTMTQPLQSTSSATGLGQMAIGTGTSAVSSVASTPASALTGLTGASGKSALKGAGVAPGLIGGGANAGTSGLALDEVGLGVDTFGLAGLEVPGLGTEFLGLGTEFYGLDLELLGAQVEGVIGPGGLGAGLIPLGGLGALGGLSTAGAASATAGMGQAASLGSLSVPQAWTVAAPTIRQVALTSLESSTAAASAAAAAGASEIPYAEMALAGMAGRAMAGTAGWSRQQRAGAPTRENPSRPPKSPDSSATEIFAKLRELTDLLHDAGILNDKEFTQQKRRLIHG
ncbi:hypothetical protein A5707_17370 [Mycobacterium kyorinense]|uniref:PPE family domain-containing protein n=1 Tax=Mycobacterium kyorinense TaxID=487514 RepID=A0A1A2ZH91_9MYCO|nr:PPE family protein [Mycobacterium kyorinense]OBI49048.1 hypothetical protein A5707_17370 [Mycobacterium kyorinense]